ncbi:hypothetical protein F5972_29030 [Microbispora cellulosiformans]|uniref:Uncharacterized protein n=1 Tax=Microbispora cellulosiformans TaxID=2614688 RepID=A0A5J5JY39_9ACTN|nr:hypothetical protein [Microbispora cellulosiformans]KAA9375010.1 hypothetical protein F5972_29030 [Microbispora cellulosiformans]
MKHPSSTAVFVDHSGRRSKILTVTAIVTGVLVTALTLTLMAGVFGGVVGGSGLPALNWPAKRGNPDAAHPQTRSPSPSRQARTPASGESVSSAPAVRTTRATRPSASSSSPAPSSVPSSVPSRRPSPSAPAEPSPEPSPRPSPSSEATRSPAPNPGHGGTPPGQVGRTRGPR